MADLTTRDGQFAVAQATPGIGANRLFLNWNAAALWVQLSSSAATNSVQLEQSIDGGVTFFLVFAINITTGALVTTATSNVPGGVLFRVDNPAGLYRANTTANTGGTTTSQWRVGAVYQE